MRKAQLSVPTGAGKDTRRVMKDLFVDGSYKARTTYQCRASDDPVASTRHVGADNGRRDIRVHTERSSTHRGRRQRRVRFSVAALIDRTGQLTRDWHDAERLITRHDGRHGDSTSPSYPETPARR